MPSLGMSVEVQLNQLVELDKRIEHLRDNLKKLNLDENKREINEIEDVLRPLVKQYEELREKLSEIAPAAQQAYKAVGDTLSIDKSTQALGIFVDEQTSYMKDIEHNIRRMEEMYRKMGGTGDEAVKLAQKIKASKADLAEQRTVVEKSTREYDKLTGAQYKNGVASETLRTQILKVREEMARLMLSGKDQTDRYRDLENELTRLGTAYNQVTKQQKLLTTQGNAMIAGIVQGITGLSGAFSAFSGVSSLFIKDQAKLAETQKNLQAAMAITIGLQQVSQTLHSTSAFRIGLVNKATTLWTSAQKALNVQLGISAVLSKALMATGIGLLIAGIIALTSAIKAQRDEQKRANEEREREIKNITEYNVKISETVAKSVASLKQLQTTWNNLADDVKTKNKFITENKDEFEKLGIEVKNVDDAENVLIRNSDAVIQAFMLRAKAIAAQELAVAAYKEAIETQLALDKAAAEVEGKEREVITETQFNLQLELGDAETQAKKFAIGVGNIFKNQAEESAQEYTDVYIKYMKDAQDILTKAGISIFSSAKNETNKIKTDIEKSIVELNKLREETEKQSISRTSDDSERQRKEAVHSYKKRNDELDALEQKWLAQYKILTDEQTKVLASARSMATLIHWDSLQKIKEAELQNNKKLADEYADYYTKRLNAQKKYEADRKKLTESGASQEILAQVDYKESQALEGIDKEFAQRKDTFQSWMNEITSMSLTELQRVLTMAEQKLARLKFLTPTADLSVERAQIVALEEAIAKLQSKLNKTPDDKSFSNWTKLQKSLRDTQKEFDNISDTIGGTTGDILKVASQLTTSVLGMINGIVLLSESSASGLSAVSKSAVAAIKAVESASVILAIISAALQIITAIFDLFNKTNYMEEFRKEVELLNYELKMLKLNAKIDAKERDTIFGEDVWSNAKNNILAAQEALALFGDTMESVAGITKTSYKMVVENGVAQLKKIVEGYDSASDAIKDMSIRLQHGTAFRHAKYTSLGEAVPGLFTAEGGIDMDALEAFVGSDTYKKLNEQSQEYLQEMIDSWNAYQDALESVKDYLSDIFGEMGTTITTALADAFRNGTDAAQTFVDSVSDMLDKLAEDMFYALYVTPLLQAAQEEMLDVMQSGASEAEQFKQYSEIMKRLVDDAGALGDVAEAWFGMVDNVKEAAGISKAATTEAKATTRGISSLTEETGLALEGRFTAMQQALELSREQHVEQTELLRLMTHDMSGLTDVGNNIFTVIDGILSYTVNSFIELQEININTAANLKSVKEIAADLSAVRKDISNKL